MSRSYDKCTMLEICPECEDLFIDINKPTALHVSIDLEGELIVTIDICGTFPMSLEAKEFNDKLYNTFKYVREENGDFVFMQFVKSLSSINSNLDVYYINLSKHAILKDTDDSKVRDLKDVYAEILEGGIGNRFVQVNRGKLLRELADLNSHIDIYVRISEESISSVKVSNYRNFKPLEKMLFIELNFVDREYDHLIPEYLKSLEAYFKNLSVVLYDDGCSGDSYISSSFNDDGVSSKEEAVDYILELDSKVPKNSNILLKDIRLLVSYYNLKDNKGVSSILLEEFKNSIVELEVSSIMVSHKDEIESAFKYLIDDNYLKSVIMTLNNNTKNIHIDVQPLRDILYVNADKLLYTEDSIDGIEEWYKLIID